MLSPVDGRQRMGIKGHGRCVEAGSSQKSESGQNESRGEEEEDDGDWEKRTHLDTKLDVPLSSWLGRILKMNSEGNDESVGRLQCKEGRKGDSELISDL